MLCVLLEPQHAPCAEAYCYVYDCYLARFEGALYNESRSTVSEALTDVTKPPVAYAGLV